MQKNGPEKRLFFMYLHRVRHAQKLDSHALLGNTVAVSTQNLVHDVYTNIYWSHELAPKPNTTCTVMSLKFSHVNSLMIRGYTTTCTLYMYHGTTLKQPAADYDGTVHTPGGD